MERSQKMKWDEGDEGDEGGEGDDGEGDETASLPSFSAKAGNPEIYRQPRKGRR